MAGSSGMPFGTAQDASVAVVLEPEVPVQPAGVVLLDDEAREPLGRRGAVRARLGAGTRPGARARLGTGAGARFGRRAEVAFAPIPRQTVAVGHAPGTLGDAGAGYIPGANGRSDHRP